MYRPGHPLAQWLWYARSLAILWCLHSNASVCSAFVLRAALSGCPLHWQETSSRKAPSPLSTLLPLYVFFVTFFLTQCFAVKQKVVTQVEMMVRAFKVRRSTLRWLQCASEETQFLVKVARLSQAAILVPQARSIRAAQCATTRVRVQRPVSAEKPPLPRRKRARLTVDEPLPCARIAEALSAVPPRQVASNQLEMLRAPGVLKFAGLCPTLLRTFWQLPQACCATSVLPFANCAALCRT
eukprot:2583983-Amphidinium_carterae.2